MVCSSRSRWLLLLQPVVELLMEKDLAIERSTDPEATIVDVELECDDSLDLATRTLVGKIFSGRFINKGAAKAILSRAWGDLSGLKITEMGTNMLMFTFEDKKDALEVIRKGQWYVMNNLVSFQYWVLDISAYELDFAMVSFWVQIHGLPLGALNTMVASKIMATFGSVKEVEDPKVEGSFLRTYIRVRTELNVNHPLPIGCWVPRRGLPKLWVVFRYERLQSLCFKCGIIGHEQKHCKKEKVMSVLVKETPLYDSKLSVALPKSLATLAAEQGAMGKNQACYGGARW